MKLLFTSDLHGLDKAFRSFSDRLSTGEFDLGVLAGDLMGFPSEEELEASKSQLLDTSQNTLSSTSAANVPEIVEHALLQKETIYKSYLRKTNKPVVFVMGNDDGILGNGLCWTNEGKIICINQCRAKFDTYNLVGYHYTSPFVGGTFEKPLALQEQDFRSLEKIVDSNTILVTHGPPLGTLDTVFDGTHVGSQALLDFIQRTRPKLHLFGHVHRTFGRSGNSFNGAYPSTRQFMAIDVDTLEMELIE
jgi:Icc-related predicted phosphoesterase